MSDTPTTPPASGATSAQARESEIEQLAADADETERIKSRMPIATMVGVSLSFVVFALLVGLMYYFTRDYGPAPKPDGPTPAQQREEQKKADTKKLGSYGWTDPQKKVAHIPIDRAMELIVKEYSSPPNMTPTSNPAANAPVR